MFDTLTMDLLFTISASSSLVALWIATAVVLPWTDAEMDEVDEDLAKLADAFTPEPQPIRARYSG